MYGRRKKTMFALPFIAVLDQRRDEFGQQVNIPVVGNNFVRYLLRDNNRNPKFIDNFFAGKDAFTYTADYFMQLPLVFVDVIRDFKTVVNPD